MTRFAIDAGTAMRIIRERVDVHPEHSLVAPNILRSEALSLLYRSVRNGETSPAEVRATLDALAALRVRLLGDRVSRATAWRIAEQLGWDDTTTAEYVAVAQLQADAFITVDARLASEVAAIVTVATFEALLTAG